MQTRRILSFALMLGASPALAQTPDQPLPADQPTQPTTPPSPTAPEPAPLPSIVVPVPVEPPPPPSPDKKDAVAVHSKYDVTLYGFVEFDSILDSTQGLGDVAGNSTIARPNTYAGDHSQLMFGARNSRIGLKVAAPPIGNIKASAQLEMDFLGNQPGTPLATNALVSEQAFWQNPALRYRHMNVKLETPAVDMLFGQTWQLFGWQNLGHPDTVQIQGVPGEIYSRSPQIRLSKKLTAGSGAVEVAIAASRPPQRASATPDGQAGVKFTLDSVKAFHSAGATGTALDGLSVGVSVVGRRFAEDEFAATPHSQVVRNGYGLSVDALLPIVPATKEHHGNALTLNGSFVSGAGIADLYQSLSGGVTNPALPNPGMVTPAPVFVPNVDPNLVQYFPTTDAAGNTTFSLHPIQWTSYLAGLQYYLPGNGRAWLAANYSHMSSDNAHLYGAPGKVWDHQNWADGNLFVDATSAVRFGVEFSWTQQTFVDKIEATDYRGQFSAFFLF